jgi:hypothetical protein
MFTARPSADARSEKDGYSSHIQLVSNYFVAKKE